MKKIKSIQKILLFFLLITITSLQEVIAQKEEKVNTVKDLIESRNYVFQAQTAMPLRAQVRQLTFGFSLKVSNDTVNSYLPYFGRAYVAPINPSEGGLEFTSSNFEYTVKNRRKGGWDIMIVTNDQRDNKRMQLTVQESGYATLQVTSNDRQPISFNGVITTIGKNEK